MQQKTRLIGCVVGTRPEIIKMAPIIFKLQQTSWAKVFIINTAQHRGLLDEMLELFNITPDIDLDIMTTNQSLGALTGQLAIKLDNLINQYHFDALLAIGDTTTVFVASLIAFYHNVPFGHIEAGLRTHNRREPFPEEINRVLASPLSTWHFAPTQNEKDNLIREQVAVSKILITGNPVIDTLFWVLQHQPEPHFFQSLSNIVVVTAHRRENFGIHMQQICQAILALAQQYPEVNFVFPVHPNPNVQKVIFSFLDEQRGIYLLDPLRYDQFVHLMAQSLLILTDSGGIQEEAPALAKPVLVLRNTTERPEIIKAGVGILVGTETQSIINAVSLLLNDKQIYANMAQGISPYGDGKAAQRIVDFLSKNLINN